MKKSLIFSCLLILIVALSFGHPTSMASEEELYAYLVVQGEDVGAIHAVNANNIQQIIEIAQLPVNNGEVVTEVFLSPSTQWLVLYVVGSVPDTYSILLFNLITEERRSIAENVKLANTSQDSAWSSNSKYFAFGHVYAHDMQGLYVFDVENQVLLDLTPDGINHYRVAWSNTGSKLVTIASNCNSINCASVELEIYEFPSQFVDSIDLLDLYAGPAGQSTNFCNLLWSPDDTRLTFVRTCDNGVGGSKEVFLIDVSSKTVEQLTSFEATDIPSALSLFTASYETIWLDNNTIVISFTYHNGRLETNDKGHVTGAAYEEPVTGTVSYDLRTSQMNTVVDTRTNLLTSINSFLAYNRIEYGDDNAVIPTRVTLNILDLTQDVPSAIMSDRPGCHLDWNSKGSILAYVTGENETSTQCPLKTTSIKFFDVETLNQYTFNSPDGEVMPVGWLGLD